MVDIYQQIWDADQQGNGIKAVSKGTPIDDELRQRINKVEYNLQLFRSPNNRNMRTFYPEFARQIH